MKLIDATITTEQIKSVKRFIHEWNSSEIVSTRTSGSTGSPKIIEHEKEKMILSAQRTNHFFNIDDNSRLLLCLSSETIAGKMMIVRSILANCELIVTDPSSSPLSVLEESPSFIAMVPMQLEQAIEDSLNSLKSIDFILIGGAPISDTLRERILKEKLHVYHSYGMTETISHVALQNVLTSTTFSALDGVTFTVNSQNELIVNDAALNITDLQTHDIVDLYSNKEFRWIGRSDLTINSGGIKIQPEDVEHRLSKIISTNFISVGLPHERLGSMHCIIIEEPCSSIDKEGIRCALGKHEYPKEIYALKEFRYTPSNKIDRIATLELIKNGQGKIL